MKIKKWITWWIFFVLFVVDYVFLSAPEKKTETCIFWIVLVLFSMWELNIENKKD